MTVVEKVLVFRFGFLGDHLVALPAYWSIREAFPRARLTLMSEYPQHSTHVDPSRILPPNGLFDEYKFFPARLKLTQPLEVTRLGVSLARARYQRVVYLAPRLRWQAWRAWRDLAFFGLCGYLKVLGASGSQSVARYLDPRYPRPLPEVRTETEDLLMRLEASGVTRTSKTNGLLGLTEAERKAAADWLVAQQQDPRHRANLIAVGPGSKWESKLFPEEMFVELGKYMIKEMGLTPVVFGGPEDRAIGSRLVAAWGAGHVAAGALNLRTAAAAMEGMFGYLGNDTGTMHLAAAVGLRCIGLFAGVDLPGRWTPIGSGHHCLRSRPPCEGCRLPVCPFNNKCLRDISDTEVHGALRAIAEAR
jgi:heptosyltransferase-3